MAMPTVSGTGCLLLWNLESWVPLLPLVWGGLLHPGTAEHQAQESGQAPSALRLAAVLAGSLFSSRVLSPA